jgi:hypothetical protein
LKELPGSSSEALARFTQALSDYFKKDDPDTAMAFQR